MLPKPSIVIVATLFIMTTVGFLSPAQARTISPDEQQRLVVSILSAHEFSPRKDLLDRTGPYVVKTLVGIASDHRFRAVLRQRAVASLGLYPVLQTRKFLSSMLFEKGFVGTVSGMLMRREAMKSLAIGFRGSVVQEISLLRDDHEAQIREGCAHALGMTGSKEAVPILEAWLPHEQELFVRVAIDHAYNTLIRKDVSR